MKRHHYNRRYPRYAFRVKCLKIIGILVIILSLHGFYIYANRLAIMFDLNAINNIDALFLTIKSPYYINSPVSWMSSQGFQSWIMPLFVLIGGILLYRYSRRIAR